MSAKELKQRRVAFKLTQVQLALLTGIPQSSISRLERRLYPQQPLSTATAGWLEKALDHYGQRKAACCLVSPGREASDNQSIAQT